MASYASDEDELADIDYSNFAMSGHDLSPAEADHTHVNENTHQPEGWWNHSESPNYHLEASNNHNHIGHQEEDELFDSDSELQMFSPATESSRSSKHLKPLVDTNISHFNSQEPTFSPSFIDPFSENLFHSNSLLAPVTSTEIYDHDNTEYFYLNRVPGENLGMVLGIEGDQENRQTIDTVVVKSVTPGGAAARSCQGKNRILVGDMILEIDGQPLHELTHDECITVFQEMPDNVVFTVCRRERHEEDIGHKSDLFSLSSKATAARNAPVPLPRKRSYTETTDTVLEHSAEDSSHIYSKNLKARSSNQGQIRQNSLDNHKVPSGFCKLDLTLSRGDEETLGISIVPSYGATCDLYQIKRLLPTGAGAQSGLLEVGDRLLTCNGQILKGLTQVQCLNVLKSSGSVVKLTVLRHNSDSDQDNTEHLSTSPHIKTEESLSYSSHLNNIDISEADNNQDSYLSGSLQETFIGLEDLDDTDIQGKIIFSNNQHDNNEKDYLVNIDDIELFDTLIKGVNKEEKSIILEKPSDAEEDIGNFFEIPPPSEFVDAESLESVEIPANKSEIPACITNIDDLLCGPSDEISSVFPNNETYGLKIQDSTAGNSVSLLASLNEKTEGDSTRVPLEDTGKVVDTAFSASDIDFTEEISRNREDDTDGVKSEATHSGEPVDASLKKTISDIDDEGKSSTLKNLNGQVTIIPVSSLSSSEEYVSRIPLSPVNQSDIPRVSESVLSSTKPNTQNLFTRNISVNSSPPVNISHIDVVSSKNVVQEEIFTPIENANIATSGVVFHTHGGSSPLTLKSATIKVDGLNQQDSNMNDQQASPVIHTTIGLTNTSQSGQEEENIKPMVVVKDVQGTPLCVPSLQPVKDQPSELKTLDSEAKEEIADLLSTITKNSNPTGSISVTNGLEKEVSEQEIIPTLLTNEQKEVALEVLNQWNAEDSLNKTTTFQKAVSGVIDNHRQPDKHILSAHELIDTIHDVSQNGRFERDLQEKELNTPSLQSLHTEDSMKASLETVKKIPESEQVILLPETNRETSNLKLTESGLSSSQAFSNVVLRNLNKSKQTTDFQQPQDPASSYGSSFDRRVKSMIIDSPSSSPSLKFNDIHKSDTSESKPAPLHRPLSALRPLSTSMASINHSSSISPGRPASGSFSSSTFNVRTSKTDYPKTRQEDGSPFQVDVLKGLAGLGLKVKVTPESQVQITEVQSGGPIDKDGHVKVGDYLLFINSTELTGQTDARVQQILRLVPRGLTKLIISSTAPGSSAETQQQIISSKSHSSLSAPISANHQSTSSVPSVTPKHSFQNKDVYSHNKALPLESISSAVNVAQTCIPEQKETSARSQEVADSSVAVEKPIPMTRVKHEVQQSKAIPHQGLFNSSNEINEIVNESTRARESQDLSHNIDGTKLTTVQIEASQEEVSFDSLPHSFEHKREINKEEAVTKLIPEISVKPIDAPVLASQNFNSDLIVSSQVSTSEDLIKSITKTELQDKGMPLPDDKVEAGRSLPHKIPPPVAPKPRLGTSSLIKSEDSVDGGEPKKHSARIISNHEESQSVTKAPRPLSVGDKTGSFVSFTAKMFDNKTTASDQKTITKHLPRDVAAHTDTSNTLNTSLLPAQNRQKSSVITRPVSLSQPLTLPSSTLPRSRTTISYVGVSSKEVVTQESLPTTTLSSSHLNAALSPRKSTSSDSPTSPTLIFPTKHHSTSKDESPNKLLNGKSSVVQQYGIYQSTPLTLVTSKSPSHVSHKDKPAPHPDDSSQAVTNDYQTQTVTSPVLSPVSLREEKALGDSINKSELLINEFIKPTEYDSPDTSLSHSIEVNSLLSFQSVDNAHQSHTDGAKKPVALPRKKPKPPEHEEEVVVQIKEEINQGLNQKEPENIKIEESRVESLTEVSNLTISPADVNTSDSSESSTIPKQASEISPVAITNGIAEILEISNETERESKFSSEQLEEQNQLQHSDYNSFADLEDPVQILEVKTDEIAAEHRQINNEPSDDDIYKKEITETFYYNSLTKLYDIKDVNTDLQKSEISDTPIEVFKTQASYIVEDVMTRIKKDQDIFPQNEKTVATSAVLSTELFEAEPPPLPGAPPPPLILRDTTWLVNPQDLMDQTDSSVVSANIAQQSTRSSSSNLEVNACTESLIISQPAFAEELQPDKTDAVQSQNSTKNNFYDSDETGVHTQSPVNLLSEDSGMPADEDQEIATEDTFSPSNEHLEPASQVTSVANKYENLIELSADSSKHEESLLINTTFDVTNSEVSELDVNTNNLPQPLLPTTTSPSDRPNKTDNLEHFLSQSSIPTLQMSTSPSLSSEVNLLGDDIPAFEAKELKQEVSISGEAAESSPEFLRKSLHYPDRDIAGVDVVSHSDGSIHNQGLYQTQNSFPVTIISKRKWWLKHNKSSSPILSGDAQVPTKVDYTEKITLLPRDSLKSVIDHANSVLDDVSAPDSVILIVVNIHQDEHSVPLDIDLAHKGGVWFQVSGLSKGSPLLVEGVIEVGDWLVSVDGLWCDHATLESFQSSLTEQKHDLLLVFARGEKAVDNAAQENTSLTDSNLIANERQEHSSTSERIPEVHQYTTEQVPIKCQLASENYLSQSDQESILPEKIPDNEPPLPDKVPQLPDNIPPLPDNEPPLPDRVPSLPDNEPPLPDSVPPLPDKVPQLPDKVPPLPDKEPPIPDKVPPLPDQDAPPLKQNHTDQLSSFPDQTLSSASKVSPLPVEANQKEGTSPTNVLQLLQEETAFQIKSDSGGSSQAKKPKLPKHTINGAPQTSSGALLKSSLTNTELPQENLPPDNRKSSGVSLDEMGPGIHKVTMIKGATGVGFCLEGGIASPKGNMPITIKRIFKGGPAEKCGKLNVRDEILEVNGVRFDSMRHYEAWNHLKFLDDGEVHITIRRP